MFLILTAPLLRKKKQFASVCKVNLKEVLNKTTNSLRGSFTATFVTKVLLVTWAGQLPSSRMLWVTKPGYFF